MGRVPVGFKSGANGILVRRQFQAVVLTLVLGACGGPAPSSPATPSPVPTAPSPPPLPPSPAPSPLPPPPVLATVQDLTVQPATVPSGQPAQGTVAIASPADAATLVFLSSSDASATVPEAVRIAEGQTRGTFAVQTQSVIFDTAVTIRATSGTSERSTVLRLVAPPPPTSGGMFLRFISSPGDYVGQGRSLRFEASSSVQFRGIVWTWSRGSSFENQLVLSVAEMTPQYRDWSLILSAPRGQRLVAGVYRNATRTSGQDGNAALSFGGEGRGCDRSTGEFEIFEARYAPRPPNGERIERLVARFRQVCSGATAGLSGELSLSNVPTY